jgi:hypothetical protein
VTSTWCREDIPAKDAQNPGSYYIRDDISNGALFSYNMKTGAGRSASDILHKGGDCDTLIISRTSIEGFIIVYDYTTDVDGGEVISNILAITNAKPNPFATAASVNFNVPNTSRISIEIFDAVGNRVTTLANDIFAAGQHSIEWNGTAAGRNVADGMYTVRISDGTQSSTYQLVLVR